MNDPMEVTGPPEVKAGMGIRRSPVDVFNAFVNPEVTKRFWINDSTGPLAPDATITWDLNAEGARATVVVGRFRPGEQLVFDWGDGDDMNTVDLTFTSWRGDGCYVGVTETGFGGDASRGSAGHAIGSMPRKPNARSMKSKDLGRPK